MKQVLITGATGFVGQHLQMLSGKNWQAVAALRRYGAELHRGSDSVLVGDIDRNTNWSLFASRQIDCVVHMAGLVHVMDATRTDYARFYDVNVAGTERLARAAVQNGVKRFIFLSSIKVNGESTGDRPFTAKDVGAPLDSYGRSKFEAEQVLFRIARGTKMEVVVIRPPLVYGPGVRANFLRLLSLAQRGVPLPLGSVRNKRSLVNVWNLCDLIDKAIEVPQLPATILLVSDGIDLSTPELIRCMASAMRRKARLLRVPTSMLYLIGKLTGRSAEVSRLCGSLVVDIDETRRLMNWSPPVSTEDAITRTSTWYLNEMIKRDG